MARISIYKKDTVITSEDKVIGTDYNGSVTKNFPLGGLSNYFSRTITVGGQVAYQFVSIKKNASLTEPADDTAFSALTNFKLSEIDGAGHNLENFLLEYSGKRIIVTQIDDKNNYGFYDVTAVIEDPNNLNYYDFALDYVSGHGNLILDKYYTISLAGGEKDKHYTHTQNSVSNTWTVSHNLNKYPSVSITVSGGRQGLADVVYVDKNTLTLNFSVAKSGYAYLN
jgi:hypothetical protein